jgi:hypothetical protein
LIPVIESKKIRVSTPQKQLLTRKTHPNARGYYHRLGYNTAVSAYTQSNDIARLSGSSINRAESKKRKDEIAEGLKEKAQIVEKVGKTVNDYYEYRRQIENIRAYLLALQGATGRLPITSTKRDLSIHFLSSRSKGKIRDKCTAFYRSCGKQRTFATLTFINAVDHKTGIAILNKFLTALREDYPKLKYLWVAEKQHNNYRHPDNIHFHLILNQRLPVNRYNSLWVLQQYNSGIEHPDISRAEIDMRLQEDSISKVLNPFDIKKIKSVYGLSWYLTKYITKNDSNGGSGFKCLAWHCSRSVSRLFTKTIISRSCLAEIQSLKNIRVDYKTGEVRQGQQKTGAFYQLYYIENKSYFLPEMSELEMVNKWIIRGWLPDCVPKDSDYSIIKFYCN